MLIRRAMQQLDFLAGQELRQFRSVAQSDPPHEISGDMATGASMVEDLGRGTSNGC